MSMLIAQRTAPPATPFRFVYGVRNGMILVPLDLTFTHFNSDVPDGTGAFIGASVDGPGFAIGTIANYNWPPNGMVNPTVQVTPAPGFSTATLPALPTLPLPVRPAGTRVETNLNGSIIQGTIRFLDPDASFIDPSHQVEAYIAQFDVPLLPDHHGALVYVQGNVSAVVGMVARAQRIFNAPNTLVCPI